MRKSGYLVIPLPRAAIRLPLAIALVAGLGLSGYVLARWAVAETILAASKNYPIPVEAIEAGARIQPRNPSYSHWLAVYAIDVEQPPNYEKAGVYLGEAIRLGPNRFDVWLTAGRRLELMGQTDEAERAYRNAASLAPSYWRPKWMLGNLYVRRGQLDDAVELLHGVAVREPRMAQLAIRTIWLASEKNLEMTKRVVGDETGAWISLVELLYAEKRVDDVLALWRARSSGREREEPYRSVGARLADTLVSQGRSEESWEIWRLVDPENYPERGVVTNGTFEETVVEQPSTPFAWMITQAPDARVSVDRGHAGNGLRIDYSAKGGPSFTHAVQRIAVKPGVGYELSFWSRIEQLSTGGPVVVGMTDVAGKQDLKVSVPLPAGTTDWSETRVRFVAPASGFVTLLVSRQSCGGVCPIFGSVWLDDFSLRQQGAADR